MRFNNPIPRTGLPRFHESSKQRSLRDGDATPKLWQKAKPLEQNGERLAGAVELLQRQFDRLRRRSAGDPGTGMKYVGEWSVSTAYTPQQVVTRGVLGEFICVQATTAGTTPESGAPYWHGWANARGAWA